MTLQFQGWGLCMGFESFYHAAKQGMIGIEQFEAAHSKGSSHGETRIIREAYHEGPFYVPMSQKSPKLFQELEKEVSQKLYDYINWMPDGWSTRFFNNFRFKIEY
ncbi:hypothetical protein ABPG74_019253 [Tetrahymena malaccensis]